MAEENRTKTQMEQELQQLRKVFSAARLLEAEAVQGKTPVDGQSCFAQWGRMDACENCAAQKALQEGRQVSKLESGGGELYRITASPVTVEGRRCVLELAQKLDPEEGSLLLDRFASQREQDYRDPLTGASTRRYYADTYQGKNLTAGVARIELDDFKLFTDVYGHYAGNSILETAAGVIRRGLEENDHLIRYTDETFLLVTDVPQERFGQKMEQIRLQLAAASVPGYSHIQLSASIGGIWVRDTDADEAVKRAGRLMRCARTQKNTVIMERLPETEADARPSRRESVLIVDDADINRKLLREMLGGQFDMAEAASGEDALRFLEQNATGISIVLLDIYMPGIDGFAVLEAMNQRHLLEEIPVIMISSEDKVDTVRRAFDLGASDYISRPFDAKIVYQRVTNTIRLYAKQRRLSAMAAEQAYARERNSQMMIGILSQVVEKRNGESRAHVQRISELTDLLLARLARRTDRYQLTQEARRTISTAAALHDIGKMEICDSLLNKAGSLTAEEMRIVQSHTLLGAKMLEGLEAYREEGFVRVAYQICRWHHERYDGSGYPDHKKGEEIPIAAQVVGLADVYERLVSKPVDGKARTHREAMQMILSGECGAFNPLLLSCLQEADAEIQDAMQRRPHTL